MKRKCSSDIEERTENNILESQQPGLSRNVNETAVVRCESEETTHLIKRQRVVEQFCVDWRKTPYMQLAKFSCSNIGDHARQAYRMTTKHLWRLYHLIQPFMAPEPLPALEEEENWNQPLRIKATLRFFAGGDPLEIAADHSIPNLWVLEEYIWDVIAAIHACNDMEFSFPESHPEQLEMATGFQLFKSDADIENCCSALGGMILPTEPPLHENASKKFFHERAGLWGINMQAVCDYTGRFLEIDLDSPASTSDYMAFMKSSIRRKLEQPGFLANGFALYCHQFYPNSPVLEKPDKTASDQHHFQLRDQIDLAFSSLLQRWALLRRPLPMSFGHSKLKSLVRAVCKLQNFCLDDTEPTPPLLAGDVVFGILNGAVLLDKTFRPARLMGAGQHMDDVVGNEDDRD